jgi:hypothetical protein
MHDRERFIEHQRLMHKIHYTSFIQVLKPNDYSYREIVKHSPNTHLVYVSQNTIK